MTCIPTLPLLTPTEQARVRNKLETCYQSLTFSDLPNGLCTDLGDRCICREVDQQLGRNQCQGGRTSTCVNAAHSCHRVQRWCCVERLAVNPLGRYNAKCKCRPSACFLVLVYMWAWLCLLQCHLSDSRALFLVQHSFVQSLAEDYNKWAKDTAYRDARAKFVTDTAIV